MILSLYEAPGQASSLPATSGHWRYFPAVIPATVVVTSRLESRNPSHDTPLCNCGTQELLKLLYSQDFKYCELGSADTMYQKACDGQLGPFTVSTISVNEVTDQLEKGFLVLAFGSWYTGKTGAKRCGHVNTIFGYDPTIAENSGRKFLAYDSGGTGKKCRRKIVSSNWAWTAEDWKTCKFFVVKNQM